MRLDREGTLEAWNQYREQVVAHFGFDEKPAAKAKDAQKLREQQFTSLLDENAEDIDKYFQGLERRDKYRGRRREPRSRPCVTSSQRSSRS